MIELIGFYAARKSTVCELRPGRASGKARCARADERNQRSALCSFAQALWNDRNERNFFAHGSVAAVGVAGSFMTCRPHNFLWNKPRASTVPNRYLVVHAEAILRPETLDRSSWLYPSIGGL